MRLLVLLKIEPAQVYQSVYIPRNVFTFCLLRTNTYIFRYVFGITHVPRLEDWPVMPVEHIGFMLMVITWFTVSMDLF